MSDEGNKLRNVLEQIDRSETTNSTVRAERESALEAYAALIAARLGHAASAKTLSDLRIYVSNLNEALREGHDLGHTDAAPIAQTGVTLFVNALWQDSKPELPGYTEKLKTRLFGFLAMCGLEPQFIAKIRQLDDDDPAWLSCES